jgi:hypothetical protein
MHALRYLDRAIARKGGPARDVESAEGRRDGGPMKGGWIGESCEKGEARPGCCCFPKLQPTGNDRFDCKGSMTEFDCRAECAMFKDGREPSGCTWAVGTCPH